MVYLGALYLLIDYGVVHNPFVPTFEKGNRPDIQSNIEPTGSFAVDDTIYEVESTGRYTYIAGGNDGLICLDTSDPTNIFKKGELNTLGIATSIFIDGFWAFVGTHENGLRIVNISNIYSPSEVGFNAVSQIENITDVWVENNIAYVAAGSSGISCLNITDKENPTVLSTLSSTNATSIAVVNGHAYVADGVSGLRIIDVTDPSNPTLVESLDTLKANNVFAKTDRAYVADDSGFVCVNISDPRNAYICGQSTNHHSNFIDLDVYGQKAYLINETATYIFNITDLNNPTKFDYVFSGGNAIDIVGMNAYIGNGPEKNLSISTIGLLQWQNYPRSIENLISGGGLDADISSLNKLYNIRAFPYFGGLNIHNLIYDSGYVYLATIGSGLRIYDVAHLSNDYVDQDVIYYNKTVKGVFNEHPDFLDLSIDGNIMYALGLDEQEPSGERNGLIYTVNLTEKSNPQLISKYQPVDSAGYIEMIKRGNTIIISQYIDSRAGILAFNISDPMNIQLQCNFTLDGIKTPVEMKAYGDILLLTTQGPQPDDNMFGALDISDPSNIMSLDNITVANPSAFAISDDLVYLDSEGNTLIYNISNIHDIQLLNTYTELQGATVTSDIDVVDDILIRSYDEYIVFINISDRLNPEYITAVNGGGSMLTGLCVEENRIIGHYISGYSYSVFTVLPIISYGADDLDYDGLTYYEEIAVGTNPLLKDTDYDMIDDYSEVIFSTDPLTGSENDDLDRDGLPNRGESTFNPLKWDTDGDGYSDMYEMTIAQTDPSDSTSVPDFLTRILLDLLIAAIGVFILVGFISAFKRQVLVRVFLSHTKEDYERYKLPSVAKSLSRQKKVKPSYVKPKIAKKGLEDEYKKKIMDNSQVFMFFATDNSLNSEDSMMELEAARDQGLFIVPVKSDSINWTDMADAELSRELGIEYNSTEVDKFKDEAAEFVKKYQRDLSKLRTELKRGNISYLEPLEKSLDLSKEHIQKLALNLLRTGDVEGALTDDKEQFLNKKEVKKRLRATKKALKIKSIDELASRAGLSTESFFAVRRIYGKNRKQRKSRNLETTMESDEAERTNTVNDDKEADMDEE